MANKLTEEQQALFEQYLLRFGERCGTYKALKFLEQELGKVHSITINFRKNILKSIDKELAETGKELDDFGIIEIFISNLENKN